jgi:hypothetical protein
MRTYICDEANCGGFIRSSGKPLRIWARLTRSPRLAAVALAKGRLSLSSGSFEATVREWTVCCSSHPEFSRGLAAAGASQYAVGEPLRCRE